MNDKILLIIEATGQASIFDVTSPNIDNGTWGKTLCVYVAGDDTMNPVAGDNMEIHWFPKAADPVAPPHVHDHDSDEIINTGDNTHAAIDLHIASTANPHAVTAAQAGAAPASHVHDYLPLDGSEFMTGSLLINEDWGQFAVNAQDAGNPSFAMFIGMVQRGMIHFDRVAGSVDIMVFNDVGVEIAKASVKPSGNISVGAPLPVEDSDLTRKDYVDSVSGASMIVQEARPDEALFDAGQEWLRTSDMVKFVLYADVNSKQWIRDLNGLNGTNGADGVDGVQGIPGVAATVDAGTATDLAPGSAPTVTNSGDTTAAVFNFGIPQGIQGVKGDQGDPGPIGSPGGWNAIDQAVSFTTSSPSTSNPDLNVCTGGITVIVSEGSVNGEVHTFVAPDANWATTVFDLVTHTQAVSVPEGKSFMFRGQNSIISIVRFAVGGWIAYGDLADA